MSKLKDKSKGIIKQSIWYRLSYLEKQNIRRAEETIELSHAIGETQNRIDLLFSDKKTLSSLKKALSCAPVIWGDEKRLHISEKASVYTALFNLNSGEISIGDYSFTGSNVSFLTGSHDMTLTGLLRRDCEIKEGNDIKVGKGVWIASNATIIGPCEIGDNAVIAAGAVVAPGTIINKGEVYGGVPAKKLSILEIEDISIDNSSVKMALERENGILFTEGWSEKHFLDYNGKTISGHYLIDDSAAIITNREIIELYYKVEAEDPQTKITVDCKEYMISEKQGFLTVHCSGPAVQIKRKDSKKILIGNVEQ